ncbi:hypothetical protein [Lentzea atacamensis]|uniref:hypothetical protein n=1 Tax=Lentzea atacamensis TaxID=531938 RepID=UPI001B87E4F1|nr:hypothetical protein [Lentzea atacamensis]
MLRRLWSVFGGTVEQFGGPSTLWLNQNAVLTAGAAATSLVRVIGDYDWIWKDEGCWFRSRRCGITSPWR